MSTKISKVSISKFTVFDKAEISFSPGLNVLIGKNGTGKTHLMKLLFSFLKANTVVFPIKEYSSVHDYKGVDMRLLGIFKANSLSDFFRNHKKGTQSSIVVELSNSKQLDFTFSLNSEVGEKRIEGFNSDLPAAIYIPPQEMLSWYDGFAASWENRESGFDETYYLLAKSLSALPLKNGKNLNHVIEPLEKLLHAKVVNAGGRFFLEYDWGRVEAHMAAEGMRKLASIIYLLGNGSLNEETIVFWDEPEVHFNPSLIEALVELIKGLTNSGVQLFITTHDYLLSQRLSLIAEYESESFPVKFFSLQNEKNKGAKISTGNTLADIEENPILDEFAEYYDFERESYSRAFKKD